MCTEQNKTPPSDSKAPILPLFNPVSDDRQQSDSCFIKSVPLEEEEHPNASRSYYVSIFVPLHSLEPTGAFVFGASLSRQDHKAPAVIQIPTCFELASCESCICSRWLLLISITSIPLGCEEHLSMLHHQGSDILAGRTAAEKVNAQPALSVQHSFSLVYHNMMLSNLQAKQQSRQKRGRKGGECKNWR